MLFTNLVSQRESQLGKNGVASRYLRVKLIANLWGDSNVLDSRSRLDLDLDLKLVFKFYKFHNNFDVVL